MFHRKQVVAGGDARTALVNHRAGATVCEQGREFAAQLLGRLEAAICPQVVLEESVQRARNVPGLGVQRLDFAAKALGRARVDQSDPAQ